MTVQYQRPISHAAQWARRLTYFSFLLAIAAWVGHRFGPVPSPAFFAIAGACVVMSALGVLLALVGFSSLWRYGARGGKSSFAAILLAIPVLAPAANAARLYETEPRLYEVSTDLLDEPEWIETPASDQMLLGARPDRSDKTREAQYLTYPALIGHRYEGALDRVVAGARDAAKAVRMVIEIEKLPKEALEETDIVPVTRDEGEELVEEERQIPVPEERPSEAETPPLNIMPAIAWEAPEARLQGHVTGFVSGLQYDFVIRLREEEETTVADIRVQARYGNADFGGSARQVAIFLKALDAELLGVAGD